MCVMCEAEGVLTPATVVDHIVARTKGGSDHEDNLQALCHRHHNVKGIAHDGLLGRPRT
jgi:5-methylcytosine-specific restriction protein A